MSENNILNLSSNEEDAELVLQQLMGGIQNMPPQQKEQEVEQAIKQELIEDEKDAEVEIQKSESVYSSQTPILDLDELANSINQFTAQQEALYTSTENQIEDTPELDFSAFESSDTKSTSSTGVDFDKMFEEVFANNPEIQDEINQKVENQTYGNPGAFVDEQGNIQKAKRNSLTLSNETFQAFKTSDAETIRAMITNEILSKYGGSIHKIVVKSGILIIDGIQPNITLNEVELAALQNCSSWSLAQHIENNELAPLFHWGVLKKNRCSSFVTTISIDNEEYWYDWVIGDLFTPRRRSNNRRQLMFNIFPYLEVLKIGPNDYSIEKGAIEKIDISNRAESVKKIKGNSDSNFDRRKQAFKDNFGFKLHKGTSSMNKWTVDNFKNYATNRGKRGLLRYTGGLAARGVIALAATAINFVTQFIHAGITPIDELEAESEEPTTTRNVVKKKASKKKNSTDDDDLSEIEE